MVDVTYTYTDFVDDSQPPILEFSGPHRFLSNFYPARFQYKDIYWPSAENAYQAMKSDDPNVWEQFLTLTPSESKQAGKRIAIRSDWEYVKVDIMGEIVLRKFAQNVGLRQLLMNTDKRRLIEGNHWHDRFWGVCPVGSDRGQNMLGNILMVVRYRLSVA